jgi:hypothetical protein
MDRFFVRVLQFVSKKDVCETAPNGRIVDPPGKTKRAINDFRRSVFGRDLQNRSQLMKATPFIDNWGWSRHELVCHSRMNSLKSLDSPETGWRPRVLKVGHDGKVTTSVTIKENVTSNRNR